MVRLDPGAVRRSILDAAESVVLRSGLSCMTLEAVAAEANMSKGGLLHHFRSKDELIEALVTRSASDWRNCYTEGYEQADAGPGRQVRGLLHHCLSDAKDRKKELQRSSCACFSALAQNPSLIDPMRDAYTELQQRVENDGLPPGVGAAIALAIDGLWIYWVLGLVKVDQDLIERVRGALEKMLELSQTPAWNSANPQQPEAREGNSHEMS